jgi:hypothetical protein
MRLRTKYYRHLRAGSTDTFRIPFGQELIRYFLATSGIRFVARKSGSADATSYVEAYQAVVSAAMGGEAGRAVLTRHHTPVDADRLVSALKANVKTATTVQFAHDADRTTWTVEAPRPTAPFKIAEDDLPDFSSLLAKLVAGKSDALRTFLESEMKGSAPKSAKVALV